MIGYGSYAYVQGDLSLNHFAYLVFSLLSFALGLNCFSSNRRISQSGYLIFTPKILSVAILSLSAYQIVFDFVFVLNRGVPALSPEGTNPLIYQHGFGIVKFIHDGNVILLSILSFKALFLYRQKRLFLVALVTLIYPMLLMEGGKAGTINLLMVCVAVVYYLKVFRLRDIQIQYSKLALASVFIIAFVYYKFALVSASGYEESPFMALIRRAINAGDATYMYFVMGAYESFEHPLNIISFLFAHISPYFGYKDELAQDLGVLLVRYAGLGGEQGYGPSSPFQVIGHLAMGNFGFVYCFFVGVLLSIVKFTQLFKGNFVIYMIIYLLIPTLTGDASLFLYYCLTLVVLSPVLLFSFIVTSVVTKGSTLTFRRFGQTSPVA